MYILPNNNIKGIIHLSGEPISKYDLLKIIADQYRKIIKIIPNKNININRSLNGEKFNKMTGYQTKPWKSLIRSMEEFNLLNK
tara:strand:- start:287 stop:535 length:249 start_codon:yes stop_codon:yes gene_type:complete